MKSRKRASRREFLRLMALSSAGVVGMTACNAPAAPATPVATPKPADPTKAPAAAPTTAPAATPAAAPAAAATTAPAKAPAAAATTAPVASGGKIKSVARNRTLYNIGKGKQGKHVDFEIWNPYAIGAESQSYITLLFEPLAFYNEFTGKEVMWLATSYEYSADFKELTIKTREGVKWSDGKPFSAEDVAYTFSTLKELGSKVKWGADVKMFVDSVAATDANTVKIKFTRPNPRFFDQASYKCDIGFYIVPKHIFQGQDWTSFKHFDLEKGLPVTTGPWKVVASSPEQKVLDRREEEWWGVKAGLGEAPKPERLVLIPEIGEQQSAQALIRNEIDYGKSLSPATMQTVFKENPKITTFSGQKSPYGYTDWWPYSLYVNNTRPPFDDKEIRWALSYSLDRQKAIDFAWEGAAELSPLPMPNYKPLLRYFDAVKDLLQKHPTTEYNPKKATEIFTRKGYAKDGQNFWVKDGKRITLPIMGGSSQTDIGQVVANLLKKEGIDAAFSSPPNRDELFMKGDYTGQVHGHGGSVADPWATLRLYQGDSLHLPGLHQANFALWSNKEYDKVVDEVFSTPMTDYKKLEELFRKAMGIWLPDLPDIQLSSCLHRVPMNTTYWTGYPVEADPYARGAWWQLTYPLVLHKLKPVQ